MIGQDLVALVLCFPILWQGIILMCSILSLFIFRLISHHQYCSLVWANQSKGGMSSLEKLQERDLRFVYNNYTAPYVDLLGKGTHTLSFHYMAMKCSY